MGRVLSTMPHSTTSHFTTVLHCTEVFSPVIHQEYSATVLSQEYSASLLWPWLGILVRGPGDQQTVSWHWGLVCSDELTVDLANCSWRGPGSPRCDPREEYAQGTHSPGQPAVINQNKSTPGIRSYVDLVGLAKV